jgi:hypothetical protein
VIHRTFLRILEELDWPQIYLITPKQFFHVEGDSIKGSYGMAGLNGSVITLQKGLRGRVLSNTIYHEIGHHLFPHRKHWWIECAAERLAVGGGRGYWSRKYGHTVDDVPSRNDLLKLFKQASKRFNDEQNNSSNKKSSY